MKDIVWLDAYVKTPPFTADARIVAGKLLRRLQEGETLAMPHSRPMPSIERGCHELRIRDRGMSWRIVYFVDDTAIVVLDVFSKKTRATPSATRKLCRMRLRAYLLRG